MGARIHELSSGAARLHAAGLNARCPRGGLGGWQAAGRPVVAGR